MVDNEQATAVSMEAWELSKENYMPVKTGRTKAVLEELSNPADTTTKLALEKTRRALEQEIEQYKGDDPLEPWLKLVKWAQEHLPGGKAELQKVLRACTNKLVNNPVYTNDKRFLRIWIQYADCLPDPSDIFLFLKEKGIGLEHALYYEAYATYLELRGNCQAAEAVYTDGINKLAHPTDRLKQKHAAFQSRMAQRAQRRIQEAASTGLGPTSTAAGPARASLAPLVPIAPRSSLLAGSSSAEEAGRSLLGGTRLTPAAPPPAVLGVSQPPAVSGLLGGRRAHTGSSAPRGNSLLLSQQVQQQQQVQNTGGSGAPASRLLGGLLGPSSNKAKASQLAIPTDEEFEGAGQRPLLPGYATMPQGVNNLKSLKPYNLMRKENQETPSTWVGHTLPQANAGPYAPTAPTARLEICVDEEFEDEDDQPFSSQGATTSHTNPSASQTLSSVLPSKPHIPAVLASNPAGGLSSSRAAPLPTARPTAAEIMAGLHKKTFPHQPPLAQPQAEPGKTSLLGSQPQAAARISQLDSKQLDVKQQAIQPGLKQPVLGSIAAVQAKHRGANSLGIAELCKPASTLAAGLNHVQTAAESMHPSSSHMQAMNSSRVVPIQQQQPLQPQNEQSSDEADTLSVEEIRGKLWLMQHPQPENLFDTPWQPSANCIFAHVQPDSQLVMGINNTAGSSTVHVGTGSVITSHKAEAKQLKQAAAPRKAFAAISTDVAGVLIQASEPSKVAAQESTIGSSQQLDQLAKVQQPNFTSEDSYIAPDSDNRLKMPCPEPTVTVATKQAFDALNDMFGDCGSAYDMPSRSKLSKANRHASLPQPALKTETAHPPTSMPATSVVAASRSHQPAPAGDAVQAVLNTPSFTEPTVTINTRAAFDALNDMWGSALPHEGERRSSRHRQQNLVSGADTDLAKMPSLPATMKPISNIDVCRLANSSKGLTVGNRTRSLVEPSVPTQRSVSAPSINQTAPSSSHFAIHEDTELISHGQDTTCNALHQTHSPPMPQGMQFNHPQLPAVQSSIPVYEDTVVTGLSELVAQVSQGAGPIQQHDTSLNSGMLLYEDTEFISAPPVTNISNARKPAAGMRDGIGSIKQPQPSAFSAAGKENSILSHHVR